MDSADGPVVLVEAVWSRRPAVGDGGPTPPRDGEAARRTRGTYGGAARRPGRAAASRVETEVGSSGAGGAGRGAD